MKNTNMQNKNENLLVRGGGLMMFINVIFFCICTIHK